MEGALEPPPGDVPNFVNPPSLRKYDILCQVVCLAVSTLLVMMRMYTKVRIIKTASWEDYTCLIAWVGLTGYAAIAFEADRYGSGIHMWNVSKEDAIQYAKLANASQIMYGPLIFITKLSILLLFLRIFVPSRKSKTFYLVHILLWTNLVFYLADTIVEIFECTPRRKIWLPKTSGKCVNISSLILITAIINVISDFSILLLPMASIWRLQLEINQKLGITAIFAAGLFGCISSIMRLVISVQNAHIEDKTYGWFGEFLWTSAEITSGILCSCLPALPAFIRHFYTKATTKFPSSTHETTYPSKYPNNKNNTSSTARSHHSTTPFHNPDDSTLLPGSFLELTETKPWRTRDDDADNDNDDARPAGLTTTIKGGAAAVSDESVAAPDALQRVLTAGDLEQGGGGDMAILKTVRVERFP